MELNKFNRTRKWLYISTATWLATTLALGAWWLYLVLKLAKLLEVNKIPLQSNLYRMLKWEGLFFFCLLTLLTITVFYLFYRDLKKSQAIRAFFASLTHELKTPLANIRMQSEIIKEEFEDLKNDKLEKNVDRLIQGSRELEQEFDKMLQLSRTEDAGGLNLHSLNLVRYLKGFDVSNYDDVEIKVESKLANSDILADDYALKVILNNLIQNSLKHNPNRPLTITLIISDINNMICLNFTESTSIQFEGDADKLGTLFYKWNSHQGSGIGLYLIKRLMLQMGGEFKITKTPQEFLAFDLFFRSHRGDHE